MKKSTHIKSIKISFPNVNQIFIEQVTHLETSYIEESASMGLDSLHNIIIDKFVSLTSKCYRDCIGFVKAYFRNTYQIDSFAFYYCF